ncbi:MAG: glutaredoxin domain-containing protein [Terrimesophilobacter sp.]
MSESRPVITMYARHTYCPDVARSRARLRELGLTWDEYDVESDAESQQRMVQLSGRGNVPTLVIGESVLVEPSNESLDAALVRAGYPLS